MVVLAPLDPHSELWLPGAYDSFTSSVLNTLILVFKNSIEAVCRDTKLPSQPVLSGITF